jgi:hypothetical protein
MPLILRLTNQIALLACAMVAGVSICRATEIIEETIEQNYPVSPTAKFSLCNDDGSVRIYGADISEMKLEATKKAYSRERLNKINVGVSIKADEIKIDTSYPEKRKWGLADRSGTVDYVIVLPWRCDIEQLELANGEMLIDGMRGAYAHAHLGNGRFFGHNCFTDLRAAVEHGALDVAYEWWEPHSFSLGAEVNEGNARVVIPSEAQFRIHAESADGHVFSDFGKDDRVPVLQDKIDFAVGAAPRVNINMRAVDGSIRIMEANP